MKIAIDGRMYGNRECTGIGTYIQRMTEELFRIDERNEYILFLRGQAYHDFVPPTPRVRKALVTPRWYTYQEQLLLPFQLAKEQFDLIHYPHFNSPILFPAKSVCTIHDITPFYFPGTKAKSGFRRWAYETVFRATTRKAERIIAVSESTKQGIIERLGVSADKIAVTYEGVDEKFREEENSGIINQTINHYGIRSPYLFYVGVWREHKNLEGLVRAFELLKEKYGLPHQLVLGGREDLHDTSVRQLIERSLYKKDIITTGFITDEDLPRLYSGADAFIIPSFIEGFGLIGIEAQACGCPVIASNTTSLPEVLGNAAEYFDPANVQDMADKIQSVVSSRERKVYFKQLGFENIKRFSWRRCAEETLAVYERSG